MPELPEVETITRLLRSQISGKKILRIASIGKNNRFFRYFKNSKKLEELVRNRTIKTVDRIGKNIVFKLSGGVDLALHLMMTGKILFNPRGSRPHDRMRMDLSDNAHIIFNDIRKFGWCRAISPGQNLGKDALKIRLKDFSRIVASRKERIKNMLLDQGMIAGIGNIYSDEILWYAGVNPLRPASSLTDKEIAGIYRAMRRILLLAVKKGGSTMRDYQKPDGSKGGYYALRKVYRMTGTPCVQDGALIQRIIVGQRTAHFCPIHQI